VKYAIYYEMKLQGGPHDSSVKAATAGRENKKACTRKRQQKAAKGKRQERQLYGQSFAFEGACGVCGPTGGRARRFR